MGADVGGGVAAAAEAVVEGGAGGLAQGGVDSGAAGGEAEIGRGALERGGDEEGRAEEVVDRFGLAFAGAGEAEARYVRIRELLGVEATGVGARTAPVLPVAPAIRVTGDPAAAPAPAGPSAPSLWPLDEPGYMTRGRAAPNSFEEEHPGIDTAMPAGRVVPFKLCVDHAARAVCSPARLDGGTDYATGWQVDPGEESDGRLRLSVRVQGREVASTSAPLRD